MRGFHHGRRCPASSSVRMKGRYAMTWMEVYPAHRQPDMEQIGRYIASPYWQQLLAWLEDTFHISPRIEYSRCCLLYTSPSPRDS